MPLNTPIKQILLPKTLAPLAEDLRSMHAIENLVEKDSEIEEGEIIPINENDSIIIKI